MLELLVAMIINSGEPVKPITSVYDDQYINLQLEAGKRAGQNIIKFKADIPMCYHEGLRQRSEDAGWSVIITPCKGFNNFEECYEFTYSAK